MDEVNFPDGRTLKVEPDFVCSVFIICSKKLCVAQIYVEWAFCFRGIVNVAVFFYPEADHTRTRKWKECFYFIVSALIDIAIIILIFPFFIFIKHKSLRYRTRLFHCTYAFKCVAAYQLEAFVFLYSGRRLCKNVGLLLPIAYWINNAQHSRSFIFLVGSANESLMQHMRSLENRLRVGRFIGVSVQYIGFCELRLNNYSEKTCDNSCLVYCGDWFDIQKDNMYIIHHSDFDSIRKPFSFIFSRNSPLTSLAH